MAETKNELPAPAVETFRREELLIPVVFTAAKPSGNQE